MICGGDCGGGGFVLVIVVFCVIGVNVIGIGWVFIMIGFFILCNIGIGCSFWRNDVIIFFYVVGCLIWILVFGDVFFNGFGF